MNSVYVKVRDLCFNLIESIGLFNFSTTIEKMSDKRITGFYPIQSNLERLYDDIKMIHVPKARIESARKDVEAFKLRPSIYEVGSSCWRENEADTRLLVNMIQQIEYEAGITSTSTSRCEEAIGYQLYGKQTTGFICVRYDHIKWVYISYHNGEETHRLKELPTECIIQLVKQANSDRKQWRLMDKEMIAKCGISDGKLF
jgi:hypothetical protein